MITIGKQLFVQTFLPCSSSKTLIFYSDRIFSKCYTKGSTVMRALRLAIPLWFLSGPRFSGIAPWGFYKEWGFCYPPPVVFIQAVVLQKLPMMFLFCPCAQSGTIQYIGRHSMLISLHPAIIAIKCFAVSGGCLDFGGPRGDNFQLTGVGPLCELQPKDGADKADESPTFDAFDASAHSRTSAHLHNFHTIRGFTSR